MTANVFHANLKMAMRARSLTALSHVRNMIPGLDNVTRLNAVALIVSVNREDAITFNHDQVAVPSQAVVAEYNLPTVGRVDRSPLRRSDVNALMEVRPPLAEPRGDTSVRYRPQEFPNIFSSGCKFYGLLRGDANGVTRSAR